MIASHRPIRLTVVLTHPVQYYAPWFRHIAAQCPEVDLMVLYGTEPTAAQQGVGFGVSFQWDTPLVALRGRGRAYTANGSGASTSPRSGRPSRRAVPMSS